MWPEARLDTLGEQSATPQRRATESACGIPATCDIKMYALKRDDRSITNIDAQEGAALDSQDRTIFQPDHR